MILPCDCIHEFQDRTHGRGNRVMNESRKSGSYRCTVCKKEYGYSGKKENKSKEKEK